MSRHLSIFFALFVFSSVAQAQDTASVTLREVQGNVEVQQNTWQMAAPNKPIGQAIRSGTGRARMQLGQGQILMASNSLMQVKNGEPSFVTGQFYLSGENHFFVDALHYFTSGKVRVDVYDNVQRIAVLDGNMRVSSVSGTIAVTSGKQYDIRHMSLAPFTETDPWYLSQYAGKGDARVEATSGKVSLQTDKGATSVIPVTFLQEGQVLTTGERSWAEVGFTGGGYLRLQPDSALSVASIEQTRRNGTKGREVTLKLLRGSAWNVVAKNQGGYQINTPTVSTAVRGTVFRVDASGLVKVFDGSVAIPSSGNVTVPSGKQLSGVQDISTLTPDASDLENEQLDKERSEDLTFAVRLAPEQQNLEVKVNSQPTAQVTVGIQAAPSMPAASIPSERLTFANGAFSLSRALSEGRYTVHVQAQRYNQRQSLTRQVIIDRHAPQLSGLNISRAGRVLRVSGTVSDLSGEARLDLDVPGSMPRQYSRILQLKSSSQPGSLPSRAFDWVLPYPASAATPPYHIQITLSDPAGNTDHATY